MKEVNNRNLWNFELGSQESMNVLIWSFIGFQQRDGKDSQNLSNDLLCRLPVISAQAVVGMDKYLDAGILLNYEDEENSQGHAHIKECFEA